MVVDSIIQDIKSHCSKCNGGFEKCDCQCQMIVDTIRQLYKTFTPAEKERLLTELTRN